MLIPVVMLTALSDMQHRIHGFRVGANAYVAKPYGVDELFGAISAARSWRAQHGGRGCSRARSASNSNSEIALLKDLEQFPDACMPNDAALQLNRSCNFARLSWRWRITPSSGANQHQSEKRSLSKSFIASHKDHLETVVRDQGSRLFDLAKSCLDAATPSMIHSPTWTSAKNWGYGAGRLRSIDLPGHGR